jgi:hypothetical protein
VSAASTAGVFYVGDELVTERAGVLGVQVDLVAGTADGEPDHLIRQSAVEVVSRTTVIFVTIVAPCQ